MGKLTLKPEQDGLGYFYGVFQADGGTIRVDVLPPKSHPRPGSCSASLKASTKRCGSSTPTEWSSPASHGAKTSTLSKSTSSLPPDDGSAAFSRVGRGVSLSSMTMVVSRRSESCRFR